MAHNQNSELITKSLEISVYNSDNLWVNFISFSTCLK